MPRGKQRAIELPDGWYECLEALVHRLGWETLEDFCEDPSDIENGLKISVKTLERANVSPRQITAAKFNVLRRKLDEQTNDDLLLKLTPRARDGEKTGQHATSTPIPEPIPKEIQASLDLAKDLTEGDKYSEAIPILQDALSAADISSHAFSRVRVRLHLAHALYESCEDFLRAEGHYRDALALVPIDNLALRHNVLHGLGDMLLFAGRLDEANATIIAAMDIAKSTGKTDHLVPSLISKSLLDRAVGNHDSAIANLDEAVQLLLHQALSIADGDRERHAHNLAICYINKALLFRDAGNLVEALALYEKAEEQHRIAGDKLDAGKTLLFCGEVHCANADWENGADYFRRALESFDEAANPLWSSRGLERLARLLATHERWEEALHAMYGAIAGAEEARHPGEQATFLCQAAKLLRTWKEKTGRENVQRMIHTIGKGVPVDQRGAVMANLSANMGKVSNAVDQAVREDEQVRDLLNRAKEIAQREHLHEDLAACLLDEAHNVTSPEDEAARRALFGQAIGLLKDALREAQSPKQKAHLMGRISALYRELGDRPETLSWLLKAGEVFKKSGDPFGLANFYGSLAEMHRAEGRLDDEIAAYRKVLSIIEGRSFYDLAAGTRINLASALRYNGEFDHAQELLNEAEAICEKHHFKDFSPAIARNRSSIERELEAGQAPSHTLPQLLDSLRQLLEYRSEQGEAYLAFWLYAWKSELLALLRSGPHLSFIVVTDDLERFLGFADKFRHLADHFLMTTTGAPTIKVEAGVLPIPPEWQFPSTFPFLFLKREGSEEKTEMAPKESGDDAPPRFRLAGPATMLPPYMMVDSKSDVDGEGHMMTLVATRLPQEAVDLMIGRPTAELIEKRVIWIPIDRSSSADPFLTDLRIGHERGLFPVYFDRMPTSNAVAARGGVQIDIPASFLGATDRPSSAAKWTRALLKLPKLSSDDAQRALLDLPEMFPCGGDNHSVSTIEIRLFEFSEIGQRVHHPALLIRG